MPNPVCEEWAQAEYGRRLADPLRKKGACGDTGLVTVELGSAQARDFDQKMREDVVEVGTKARKNPTENSLADMVGNLGSEYSTASAQSCLARSDFAGALASELSSLHHSDQQQFLPQAFLADLSKKEVGQAGSSESPAESPPDSKKRVVEDGTGSSGKKKARFFDLQEQRLKLQTQCRNELSDFTRKIDNMLNQAREVSASVTSEMIEADPTLFKTRVLCSVCSDFVQRGCESLETLQWLPMCISGSSLDSVCSVAASLAVHVSWCMCPSCVR